MVQLQQSTLPSWLHYSQYFPLSTRMDNLAELNTLQLKPSIGQMVRSKRVRFIAATFFIITSIYIFYGLKTSIHFDFLPNTTHSATNSEPLAKCAGTEIDWSRFAYTQYVTNTEYLCNSVMLFEILHRLGSRADRLMMYPAHMEPDPTSNKIESKLLLKAQKDYGVNLMPIEVQHRSMGDRKNNQTLLSTSILMN